MAAAAMLVAAGATRGYVVGANSNSVLWCASVCDTMHLARIDGSAGDINVPASGAGRAFVIGPQRVSPDGRYLAVVDAAFPFDQSRTGVLTVVDLTNGRTRVWSSPELLSAYAGLGWADDSQSIWVAGATPNDRLRLHHVDLDTVSDSPRDMAVPYSGGALVPLTGAEARWLKPAPTLGTEAACPPPTVQPSGRGGPCSFSLR